MVNKRETDRVSKILEESLSVNMKSMNEYNEKKHVEWLHNPVVLPLVPKVSEPDDGKAKLEPGFDMRAYQPTWFEIQKKHVREQMLLDGKLKSLLSHPLTFLPHPFMFIPDITHTPTT